LLMAKEFNAVEIFRKRGVSGEMMKEEWRMEKQICAAAGE